MSVFEQEVVMAVDLNRELQRVLISMLNDDRRGLPIDRLVQRFPFLVPLRRSKRQEM